MKLTMYEKVVGYSMTWAEEAVEKYPFTSALVMALIIDHILWS